MQTGIYYINLDRVPQRREFMEQQFNSLELAATRFSAVDASKPPGAFGNGYRPGSGLRWGLKLSEIACFESHRAIWQRAVADDLAAVAIFEDDVQMSCSAGRVIRAVLEASEEFDMVKLDYSPRALRFGPKQVLNGMCVRPMLEMAPSAAAYVLSQSGCRKLLNWSRCYSDHLDDFISIPRPDWKMFQAFPAVGVQLVWSKSPSNLDAVVKSSERESDPTINSNLDKGPPWFRLRRELYGAGEKLRRKVGGDARLKKGGGFIGFIPGADDLSV